MVFKTNFHRGGAVDRGFRVRNVVCSNLGRNGVEYLTSLTTQWLRGLN